MACTDVPPIKARRGAYGSFSGLLTPNFLNFCQDLICRPFRTETLKTFLCHRGLRGLSGVSTSVVSREFRVAVLHEMKGEGKETGCLFSAFFASRHRRDSITQCPRYHRRQRLVLGCGYAALGFLWKRLCLFATVVFGGAMSPLGVPLCAHSVTEPSVCIESV